MKLKNVRKEIKIVQNRIEMSQAEKFQHKNWENHALKLPKRVFFNRNSLVFRQIWRQKSQYFLYLNLNFALPVHTRESLLQM